MDAGGFPCSPTRDLGDRPDVNFAAQKRTRGDDDALRAKASTLNRLNPGQASVTGLEYQPGDCSLYGLKSRMLFKK